MSQKVGVGVLARRFVDDTTQRTETNRDSRQCFWRPDYKRKYTNPKRTHGHPWYNSK